MGNPSGMRVLLLAILLMAAACTPRAQPAPPPTTIAVTVGQPRPNVTPGAVLTTNATDVCTAGWASKHRHGLTTAQKATILAAYGYPAGQKVAEYDHLISLELGGGNGTRNIWPQVDHAQAERKDRLENTLHAKVCTGKLSLDRAQTEIRQFWLWW
jgi:hypothetical protein